MNTNYVLSVKNVCKYFPGVCALDRVDFNLLKGEIHALVGENGAGKSTLIKILSGVYACDEGTCHIEGKSVNVTIDSNGIHKDVGVIYQELNSAEYLTVAENIMFDKLPVKHGIVQWKETYRAAQEYMNMVGLNVHPKTKVQQLSIAQKQLIEIAKAISQNAKVLIMDEPTSALSPTEIRSLFNVIRSLKEKGKSIVYISHKLDEVLEISDRITVLRDGCVVDTVHAADVSRNDLIAMMVGRQVTNLFPSRDRTHESRVLFEVKGLTTDRVEDISFYVKQGEIIGFSGLMGAGRTEMANALFGIDKKSSGAFFLDGKELALDSPLAAKKAGLGYVTENRKELGIFPSLTVKQNISVSSLSQYSKLGIISSESEVNDINKMIRDLAIKTPSIQQIISKLSGGNQQKALLARWLIKENLKVLIVDEPTRGIDVGAKLEIYKILNSLSARGLAIIIISSEMPELLGVCDRIYVMRNGRITGEHIAENTGEAELLEDAIN